MDPESASYFLCIECGVAKRSINVEYDALGYPICPACGTRSAPSAAAATRASRG